MTTSHCRSHKHTGMRELEGKKDDLKSLEARKAEARLEADEADAEVQRLREKARMEANEI